MEFSDDSRQCVAAGIAADTSHGGAIRWQETVRWRTENRFWLARRGEAPTHRGWNNGTHWP